jgi:hypothetical membrane protein
MTLSNKKTAGLLLFTGTAISFFGILVAETQFPGYSTANNYISDLGVGPAANIFNFALILGGLFSIASAFYLQQAFKNQTFTTLIALSAIGTLGVGLFPENTGAPHAIAALLVFVLGAAAAIYSAKFQKTPFAQISVALGAIMLAAFILFIFGLHLGLGVGGMERMITYPSMLWSIGFGWYMQSLD